MSAETEKISIKVLFRLVLLAPLGADIEQAVAAGYHRHTEKKEFLFEKRKSCG